MNGYYFPPNKHTYILMGKFPYTHEWSDDTA